MTTPHPLPVPAEFEQSSKDFDAYPANVLYKPAYPVPLNAYRERLQEIAPNLLSPETNANAHIREWNELRDGR